MLVSKRKTFRCTAHPCVCLNMPRVNTSAALAAQPSSVPAMPAGSHDRKLKQRDLNDGLWLQSPFPHTGPQPLRDEPASRPRPPSSSARGPKPSRLARQESLQAPQRDKPEAVATHAAPAACPTGRSLPSAPPCSDRIPPPRCSHPWVRRKQQRRSRSSACGSAWGRQAAPGSGPRSRTGGALRWSEELAAASVPVPSSVLRGPALCVLAPARRVYCVTPCSPFASMGLMTLACHPQNLHLLDGLKVIS